jgi:hypothetical protein
MLEAMPMTIPVVTTDVPDCREMVTDRINELTARFSIAPVNGWILVVLRDCLE